MKESLEILDTAKLNFSPTVALILNIVVAFIMFGVALDIKWEHFKALVMRPKSVIIGVISQFILLPAVTFLCVVLINPTPTVALGMLLIASCPGGNISNFMSAMAKGNLALSVSLTAVATLAATFMTPLNFAFWGELFINFHSSTEATEYLAPIKINFLQMVKTVLILLGIPVVSGLLFSQYLPKITLRIKKPIRQASILIFIGFVIFLLIGNFQNFRQFIHLIFIIVLIHNAIALITGYSISSLFRLPKIDRRSITIETGIQNSALALALMFNPKIFPPELELGGMTIIAAWWGVWHIISGFAVSSFMARTKLTK